LKNRKIAPGRRLIVALDVPTAREAMRWVRKLSPKVKIFKIGLELFCAAGPSIVKKITEEGADVFLDLKFLDIPNTMAGAVASAARLKPFLLNVHGLAGPKALSLCAETVKKANRKTRLIAVTLLTSYDETEAKRAGIETPVKTTVAKLCGASLKAGLAGVVASPLEVKMLRKKFGENFIIVTPGVRPEWAVKNDQKRVATPRDAIRNGADYLVVGRPVLGASDPLKAAEMIIREILEAV